MTLQEIQDLKDNHIKADRILGMIRARKIWIKSPNSTLESKAIFINQCERLEFAYDDLICKIADVSITSRKVNA